MYSAALDEIAGHGYVLTPGRYVGVPDVEDDGEPFPSRLMLGWREKLRRLGYDG